jgi:protein O-mannosyl-transferase
MRLRRDAARRLGQLRLDPRQRTTESPKRSALLQAIFLVVLTLVAYGPVIQAGFIWDDDAYVSDNLTLRTSAGLERIWFDRHANPQYYPLVHTSFWMEYHLWGLHPLGYHLVNVALHAVNAVLLLVLLRRLRVPGALFAATLFAVHPVAVESVAWITERKNVLSTALYFGSFLALLKFWPSEQSAPRAEGRWRWYALALGLFVLALLSKTVVCSLPAAFLLVRWWKVGALSRRDWLVAAPLFALGLALGLNTAFLEKAQVGARGADWDFSIVDRALIAGRALWFYAGELAWPAPLTFIYPRWSIDAGSWWQWLFPATAFGLIAALWLQRGRVGRGPLTAVLFFAGTLVPALGFFNVYPMRFSFVADHFQYLACVGLLALAAAGAASLCARYAHVAERPFQVAACVVVAVLAGLSWQQTRIYKDALTLWNDTLAKNPDCWLALTNRGFIEYQHGDVDRAFADFSRAIELKDSYEIAFNDRGSLYQKRGRMSEAVADFRKAIELQPSYADAHCNLGVALQRQGDTDQAIVELTCAIALQADHADAYNSRGAVYLFRGRHSDAVADFNKAIELRSDFAEAFNNRGECYRQLGDVDLAIRDCTKALQLRDAFADAFNNRGVSYLQRGDLNAAVHDFGRALELEPESASTHFNRGLALHRLGRLENALSDYSRAIALRPTNGDAFNNRANVLLQLGHAAQALDDYTAALALQPESTALLFNRAFVYFQMRQYDAAWEDLRRGRQLGGQAPSALVNALTEALGGSR